MIASYIALWSQIIQMLLLGTCKEIFLHHVIYFYLKVVLYHLLIMDLGDISFTWPKVAWPVLSSIIAFSISTCSAEVGRSSIVHRLNIGGMCNASYVLISHHRLSLHAQHIPLRIVLSMQALILKEIMHCME